MKSKAKNSKGNGGCCGGGCGCDKSGQSQGQAPSQQDALILAQVQSQIAQSNISTLLQALNLAHTSGGEFNFVIDDKDMRDAMKAAIAKNVALVSSSAMLLQ